MKNETPLSTKLEDYIIKETIGKGTFSKVKLGIHKTTKAKVAIKFLKKYKIKDKDDLERINREMKIIEQLTHINVIQVLEMFQTEEYYLIIMEYCEGGELFNYIVEKQRLSENEAAYFYYQLINGIEYIHSMEVVHRDLKPENLLLGKDNILKIIDFGLSNYSTEKYLSTPCGSPCYASPEMVSGKKYNGFYIDVWSSGIILYAMICGYLPFEDEKNEILFKKILECKTHFPSYISFIVKDLLLKIMITKPEERIKIKEIKMHPFYLIGKKLFMKVHRKSSGLVYNLFPTEYSNPKLAPLPQHAFSTKASYKKSNHEICNTQANIQKTKLILKIPKVKVIDNVIKKQSNNNKGLNIAHTEANANYQELTVPTNINTNTKKNSNMNNITKINIEKMPVAHRNKKKHENNLSHLLDAKLYTQNNHSLLHPRTTSTRDDNRQLNRFKEKYPIMINNAIINVNMFDPVFINNTNTNINKAHIGNIANPIKREFHFNEKQRSTRANNPFSTNHYAVLPTSPNVESKFPSIRLANINKNKFYITKNTIVLNKDFGMNKETAIKIIEGRDN